MSLWGDYVCEFRKSLKFADPDDAKRVHIYKKIKADAANTAIVGSATDKNLPAGTMTLQNQKIEITSWVNPADSTNFQGDATTKDATFGIEGLFFRYKKITAASTPYEFDGEIDLTLELRNGTTVVHSDSVKLKVAPWMMLSRAQASQEVWALDAGTSNDEFRLNASAETGYNGLDDSGQLQTAAGAAAGSQWFQDHIEIGYTQRPGGPKTHIVFRLPYYSTDQFGTVLPEPTWPLTKLLKKNVGTFQLGVNLAPAPNPGGSGDYGGNLEILIPTTTHPVGRIAMGNTVSQKLQDFLTSQEVQSPFFDVPVQWLGVGHIDEVTSFLTAGKVAIADPTAAWNLISDTANIPVADRHKAVFFATGPQPKGGKVGAAIANRLYDGPAIGEIKTVDETKLVDGEKFTIMASATVAKTFEFDLAGGVAAGNVAIDLTGAGASTADQVRDTIVTAVNAAGFDVKAVANGSATVHLWNQTKGTGGNQAITEMVTDAGFTVTGMSGGKTGGQDFSTLTGWQYLRTWKFTPAAGGVPDKAENGQVARIKTGGLHDGWVEIDLVWETSSKIIAGGVATKYIQLYKSGSDDPNVDFQWLTTPAAGDKYVIVKGTRFWLAKTVIMPAIVSVEEVLADGDFKTLNLTNVQGVIDTTAGNNIKDKLNAKVPAGALTFVKVPNLFFGTLTGFATGRSAAAFNPGPTNLQPVNGKLYVPRQFGPMATAGTMAGKDLYQEDIKSKLGATVRFVDDWDLYHRLDGEVHCGSNVRRDVLGVNWWENQP